MSKNETHRAHTLTYEDLERALERETVDTPAAECHGLLCGLLCGPEDTPEEAWFGEVCEDVEARPELLAVLRGTREDAVRQLFGGRMDFTPLLPGDEEALSARSTALGSWCDGFLVGLTLAGVRDWEALSDEAREIISDFSEFTRIEPEPQADEAGEAAYAELVEYVRVGVLLLNEELHPFASHGSESLH
ncbi:MAG: UPF0149 family protein [Gammaproteobacteria bacterium]|nr:UPF0149 family protein [Gammaproteobacteria bacterium]NIR81910.1 UPF0149 family protein [Gammaproteobacteria bacterium]NIR88742.1 UPF0149 family protein [Gammaproteobacteria bacterium]NIU03018.1 UPF0149 family protein [Gammaproteobacteria bacterium]NIV50539.1 UPF0149 family protein [Gammaproteobacteria bacterium]